MSKTLVAYFSSSRVAAKMFKTLADSISADLYEIQPETPYTQADLDWTNKKSRSSVEMNLLEGQKKQNIYWKYLMRKCINSKRNKTYASSIYPWKVTMWKN